MSSAIGQIDDQTGINHMTSFVVIVCLPESVQGNRPTQSLGISRFIKIEKGNTIDDPPWSIEKDTFGQNDAIKSI